MGAEVEWLKIVEDGDGSFFDNNWSEDLSKSSSSKRRSSSIFSEGCGGCDERGMRLNASDLEKVYRRDREMKKMKRISPSSLT